MNINILAYNIPQNKITNLKNNNFIYDEIFSKEIKTYLEKNNIKWICKEDKDYHFKFHKIYSAPYIIFYKWNLDLLNKNIIWIVWPRRPTNYAIDFLNNFFEKISWAKWIVTISWMAPGVDALTHNLSIKYQIPTIAILGWWFDYFLKNKKKQINQILENNGLIISEFKIFQKPEKYTFPQRNRIIAWLSDILIVPEAWEKSGSLITVDFALKMKKEIFGLPNNITALNSKWINKYICENKIKGIYDLDVFIKYLNKKFNLFSEEEIKKSNIKNFNINNEEKIILENIKNWINDLTKLNIKTNIEIWKLMVILTNLEIKWLIKDIWWEYKLNI